MPKHLVIVESPAKARTIERYLGPDYVVLASYGHVRDLPDNPGKGRFGVDVDHEFEPDYVVPDDRRRQVAAIEKAARGATDVFLATDLDREGEAIAWHVAEAARLPSEKTRRVTFSEITEGAIRAAIASPRRIDRDLVDAQQARRIVDRLVGYTLSPLVSRKVRSGLSAGRVQSVAVRMVVDREREIRAFAPREHWSIEVRLRTEEGEAFTAQLVRIDGRPLDLDRRDGIVIVDAAEAAAHAAELAVRRPVVASVEVKGSKRAPAPAFTTSTLQQEASRKLGFSPKRTMRVAQDLYEGVDTPDGHVGLITYMRTDSTAIAAVARAEAEGLVRARYGDAYAVAGGRLHRTKQKGAQEAHEAIRPTSFARDPEALRAHLKPDEHRLYRLVWQRALASQMAEKQLETTTAELDAGRHRLRASATRTRFDGFSRVYTEGRDDGADEAERTLPALREGATTTVEEAVPAQHFTEPPPRYSEASLVKALEEHGIGRPSTYAATLSTIVERGYVRVAERRLVPEEVGEVVTDLLVEHFPEYVDLDFTKRMEEGLDEVAEGRRAWVPLVRDFFLPLRDRVDEKRRELKRSQFTTRRTDECCSEGHEMVERLGRNGRFLACSTYPEHKETRPLPGDEGPALDGTGEPCPECEEGTLATRRGRFGPFVGCSRYPACSYIRRDGPPPPPPLPFEVRCPKDGAGTLVARRARRTGNVFWGCSGYPACDVTTNHEPVGAVHDAHEGGLGAVVRREDGGRCLTCGAAVELPVEVPLVGLRLPGGPPDPAALAKPARAGRGGAPRGRGRPAGAGVARGGGHTAGGASRGGGRARRAAP